MKYDVTKGGYILLGRCGENLARTVEIDVSEYLKEYPGAVVTLLHRRHGESGIYPVAVELRDGCLVWQPTSADTAIVGDGEAEVRVTVNGVLAKSKILSTMVDKSLTGQETDAPEPGMDWVDKITTAIGSIKNMKAEAESVAYGEPASAEYDGKTGTMHFGIPEGRPGRDGTDGKDGAPGAKGDPGGQGPKGDPGSDANVTAENIEAALGYAPVKDVQVAGSSVLEDGVANVPIATKTVNGVMRPDFYGVGVSAKGTLYVQNTSNINITNRVPSAPLTAYNLDYAVKAAMCDGKGAAWNRDEKNAAQRRAGINELYELIEEFDLSEASTFERTEEPDGTPFAFIDVITQIIVPTDTSLKIGEFYAQAKNIAGNFVTVGRGYMSGKSSGNSRMGYEQRTRICRGYWESAWGDWTTNLSVMNFGSADIYSFWLKYKESEYKAINKIYETTVLPAGTHIRIFGVRA